MTEYDIDYGEDESPKTGHSSAWNDDEENLTRKPFTIVVSLDSLLDQNGIIEDMADTIRSYHDKGYYVLIDSHVGLMVAMSLLEDERIPFDGLTYDGYYGKTGDLERYIKRVDNHIRWTNVTATMNTSSERYHESIVMGKESILVECGSITQREKKIKNKVA